MKIIILAAGKGTRLGKLNNNKPKCLLKIGGSSLIERNIYLFNKANLEPIIVTGFKKEKLNFLNVTTVFNINMILLICYGHCIQLKNI